MKRTRRIAVVAAVVAAATAAALLPGSAGAATRSQTAPETLKIASIGLAANYATMAKGVQARFDVANQNKELPGGRTLQYMGLIDDKGSAEGTTAALRQAKEQDGVFAVVGSIASFLTPEYVNAQKLPYVGWGISDAFCTHGAKTTWYLIGITGCLNATNPAYTNSAFAAAMAKQVGGAKGKTVLCEGEDSPAGKIGVTNVCGGFTVMGFDVVGANSDIPASPATVSDWSPYVQKVQTADKGQPADIVTLAATPTNNVFFGRALTQAGYSGIFAGATFYAPQLVSIVKGAVAYTQWATPESAPTNPQMAAIVSALNAQGIETAKIGQTELAGWFAADMFIAITKKAGKNLTAESWAKAASKIKWEIKDTIGPTVYPTAFAAPTPCSQLAQTDGTKYNITVPYACYDNIVNKNGKGKLVPYNKVNPNLKY